MSDHDQLLKEIRAIQASDEEKYEREQAEKKKRHNQSTFHNLMIARKYLIRALKAPDGTIASTVSISSLIHKLQDYLTNS